MKNQIFPARMVFCSIGFLLLILAAGCIPGRSPIVQMPFPTQTPTPFQPLSTSQPGVNSQENFQKPIESISLWINPGLPPHFLEQVDLPDEIEVVQSPGKARLRLQVDESEPLSQWVYALVAPFPTVVDGVASADLKSFWSGHPVELSGVSTLIMDAATLAALQNIWGSPSDDLVRVVDDSSLLDEAWEHSSTWALIPFEEIVPRWKVLALDGISPLHKDFNLSEYPLAVPISLVGESEFKNAFLNLQNDRAEARILPASNRDAEKLTVLAMTGVTAMVRATAHAMERYGITYPAIDIGDWLRDADLTHISNEVPFAENCPYPNPVQVGVTFCSRKQYIELMEFIATDIVELTGDHFADYGPEAMLLTLELYQERGWHTYGGGANLEEGKKPLLLEHNGNRLAFIGCNAKGYGFATAGAESPGAVYCDFEYLQEEIRRLKTEGYLPIATFQHFEYYTYPATPVQQRDFRQLADAGAVIVSGSQAHHPQAFEFRADAFIHYGLGNLFFDQYDVSLGTRQAFIDRHIFYDGQHISTELLTILFIDYARPRPMTLEERQALLQVIFSVSQYQD